MILHDYAALRERYHSIHLTRNTYQEFILAWFLIYAINHLSPTKRILIILIRVAIYPRIPADSIQEPP